METKVLFLLPYPLYKAPSQRFRVEAFFPYLDECKIKYRTHQFLNDKAWVLLYKNGSSIQKGWAVILGFIKRLFAVLFIAPWYEYIFIHREASPLGPPIFEWILAKVLRKKIIFDFDDAIWMPIVTDSNKMARYVKCFWKIKYICAWAYKISAGNAFLAEWAKQYNKNVIINPTSVDMIMRYNRIKEFGFSGTGKLDKGLKRHVSVTSGLKAHELNDPEINLDENANRTVIGWTGSHSPLKYLDIVLPVLKRLENDYDFEFLAICNQAPSFQLKSLRFIPWQEATEIDDLLRMDIGIMPLIEDAWSEGKCGFKIIQYLALGIPAVANPVGVNKTIVENKKNGYLCRTEEEWYDALSRLLLDSYLREKMGKSGREKILSEYSVQANFEKFKSLLQ